MCTVSMVMDHYGDEWNRRYWRRPAPILPMPGIDYPLPAPLPSVPLPTQQELDEFRRLLDRAREYDKKNAEPDCEMDAKKKLLRDMAEKLGVDISFIEAAS